MTPKNWFPALAVLLLALVCAAQTPPAADKKKAAALADSAAQKFAHIQRNGMQAKPDQTPTVFTQDELNAYFSEGRVKLPTGVTNLRFSAQAGVITGNTQVDFDKIRAGQNSSNPLLSVFSGIHDVQAVAHASGSGGAAQVEIESVAIDGVVVPRFALEMFVEKFIRPRYPRVGLESQFRMPDRVDTAEVGDKKLTLTQK